MLRAVMNMALLVAVTFAILFAMGLTLKAYWWVFSLGWGLLP